jgi:hypothetical protein
VSQLKILPVLVKSMVDGRESPAQLCYCPTCGSEEPEFYCYFVRCPDSSRGIEHLHLQCATCGLSFCTPEKKPEESKPSPPAAQAAGALKNSDGTATNGEP